MLLEDFGLDMPTIDWASITAAANTLEANNATRNCFKTMAEEMYLQLNNDQRVVFDRIMSKLHEQPKSAHFYL
jgi:hypothetical protein